MQASVVAAGRAGAVVADVVIVVVKLDCITGVKIKEHGENLNAMRDIENWSLVSPELYISSLIAYADCRKRNFVENVVAPHVTKDEVGGRESFIVGITARS